MDSAASITPSSSIHPATLSVLQPLHAISIVSSCSWLYLPYILQNFTYISPNVFMQMLWTKLFLTADIQLEGYPPYCLSTLFLVLGFTTIFLRMPFTKLHPLHVTFSCRCYGPLLLLRADIQLEGYPPYCLCMLSLESFLALVFTYHASYKITPKSNISFQIQMLWPQLLLRADI